jgi:geranylgeranyl diphosphate synthase type II
MPLVSRLLRLNGHIFDEHPMDTSLLTYRAPTDASARFSGSEAAFDSLRTTVDRRLRALAPRTRGDQHRLQEAMHGALLAPGKRLRPLCVILAARDLGCDEPHVVDLGCALEMVHTASLLLDDLPCMDDATLRRGAPATHVEYGESVAMLAAIAMLTRSFEVVSTVTGVTADMRAHLVAVLASGVGTAGLVAGQFYDLHQQDPGPALQNLASTNELKTGALFLAGVEMASAVAGACDTRARALRLFASELGRAFQLLDDLLDRESDTQTLGKDVGQDSGKATLAEILGKHGARERLRLHLESMEDALQPIDGGTGSLRRLTHLVFSNFLR